MVVVSPDSVAETCPSLPVTPAAPDWPGKVAYTVAVEVCLTVVVTTVVDDPEPRVYVRTTDSDPVCSAPDDPLAPAVGAAVTPVLRGTVADAGLEVAPPAVAVAEYEALAAELADSASSTGQTVVVTATVSVITISLVDSE